MPYYRTQLLSNWPKHLPCTIGKRPMKIPETIINSAKNMDFVGYAPNAGLKRNQDLVRSQQANPDIPKFRSEQERERQYSKAISSKASSFGNVLAGTGDVAVVPTNESTQSNLVSSSALATSTSITINDKEIPKCYRKVEIKYSKFGVEDFDFAFYNKTPHGGLETHIQHSYCNSMIQVMFYNPHVREICLNHMKRTCKKEFCLM